LKGDGIQKVGVQLPYTWGYVDSINRIRRCTAKVVEVVVTCGNRKAISGGMGTDRPLHFQLIEDIIVLY